MGTISCGTVGAAGELIVAADLMRKGYSVFRNMSPNGLVDLIASKDDRLWRIQVKVRDSGTSLSEAEDRQCDVLAIVTQNGVPEYYGDFEEARRSSRARRCAKTCLTTSYDLRLEKMVYGPRRCTMLAKPGEKFCSDHLEPNTKEKPCHQQS